MSSVSPEHPTEGDRVLIIWRKIRDLTDPDASAPAKAQPAREHANHDLEELFRKQEFNPKDMEFDLIYVNGDNNVENTCREDETWKVRLIEEEFHWLMFDVRNV